MKNSFLHILLLSFLLVIPFSCKKFIEKQTQNAIVDLVTTGYWRVAGYYALQKDTLTDLFTGYSFKFNENNTVYGTRFGQQTNGTWSVDVPTKSITSTFPSATFPITLLNYTWRITDSYTDSVAAKTAIDSSFNILLLRKIE